MARIRRRYVRQMPKIYGNLQRKPRSFAGFFRFVRSLMWLALGGCGLYAVFFSGWFSIKKVEVEGTNLISAESVRQQVPSGGLVWFFPTQSVTKKLLEDNRIESVAILKGLPDSIRVVVKERKPQVVWVSGTNSILLDEGGVAFVEYTTETLPPADTSLGKQVSELPHVQDTKSLPVTKASRVVSKDFISFINETTTNLSKHLPELVIDHFEVADTTYDVTLVAKQGMRVQLNSLADAGAQVRNLARLVTQKKASFTSQVDLRIDRWAYVL